MYKMPVIYVVLLAAGLNVILADDTGPYGRSFHSYPDPLSPGDFQRCNRIAASYICDPDRLISLVDGNLTYFYQVMQITVTEAVS